MWTTEELGLAVWSDGHATWSFDVRGGEPGIGILASPSVGLDSRSVDQRFLSVLPVDGNPLPSACEQYIRRDQYRVNYPQGDGRYAIRLSLEPIESHHDRLVLEATISIQTDLLDAHPMLDLVAEGNEVKACDQQRGDLNWRSSVVSHGAGAPPITMVRGEATTMAVLLGPHDSPFTSNHSTDCLLSLRLFGDFLEKGVIRTARPWIVIDRSGDPDLLDRLRDWHDQLCNRPLPLSA